MKNFFLASVIASSLFSAQAQNAETLNEKQVAKLDVSGKWVGKRHQYTADQKGVMKTFEYELNLKQEGNIITGSSSIVGSNGDFGDIKIRGVVSGNKLIFEEFEVLAEHHSEADRTWCFKAGELSFVKSGEKLKLVGSTKSFIPFYNLPCTGGYTEVVKFDEGSIDVDFSKNFSNLLNEEDFGVNVFPNPFFDRATINFRLEKDAKVQLQIMDMQGSIVAELQNGKLAKGNHNLMLDASLYPLPSGNLIVLLKVNGETHSRLLGKMNY